MSRPQHNSESELLEKRHIMKKQIIRATLTAFAVLALVAGSTALRAQQPKDIVDTAVAAGSFKTLAAALTAAGLIDTLKGDGPFTVFAPTDAAFAKLPPAPLKCCSSPRTRPS